MNRAARVALSEETLKIIDDGGYQAPSGGSVVFVEPLRRSLAGTRLLRTEDFPADLALERGRGPMAIEVTDETTLAATARLSAAQDGEVFVLNFASAKNPGGGFLSGSQAQEESLARSSTLYASLMSKFDFYEFNRAGSSALYSDWMIHSPHVTMFRDDDGNLLDRPYQATLLTSPAVNAGAVRRNSPELGAQIDATNRERARKLLWVANRAGHRTLVLGAWGCGVFENDPAVIAGMFGDLLEGAFADCFAHVVMAIYDRTPDRAVLSAFNARFAA